MFDVFPVVRHLHELLRYLDEALTLPAARPAHADVRRLLATTERLAGQTPEELGALDLGAHRQKVSEVLLRTSELVRAGAGGGRRKDRRGADLMGARLQGADLRGADLIGADLRDTDLTDADLTGALFLTQPQLNAARGSAGTRLPGSVGRPDHWTSRG
jgi:uncharacterized protein YjbI with pentapeptide repeats